MIPSRVFGRSLGLCRPGDRGSRFMVDELGSVEKGREMTGVNCWVAVGLRSIVGLSVGVCIGCVGDGRSTLSAMDSVDVLGDALAGALGEYRDDLERLDDEREQSVIDAFVDRVRRDVAGGANDEADAAAFRSALAHIRADRRVALERYLASRENLATIREVTSGLRRLALESMSFQDETRRYFSDLIERSELRGAVSGKLLKGADRGGDE